MTVRYELPAQLIDATQALKLARYEALIESSRSEVRKKTRGDSLQFPDLDIPEVAYGKVVSIWARLLALVLNRSISPWRWRWNIARRWGRGIIA